MSTETKCPFIHAAGSGTSNQEWWPDRLNLGILRQNSPVSNPMGQNFNYAEEFNRLDLDAVKQDLSCADDSVARLVAGRLSAITVPSLCAWHGIAPAPIVRATGVAALARASSALRRSIAGPTTSTWTRRGD